MQVPKNVFREYPCSSPTRSIVFASRKAMAWLIDSTINPPPEHTQESGGDTCSAWPSSRVAVSNALKPFVPSNPNALGIDAVMEADTSKDGIEASVPGFPSADQ